MADSVLGSDGHPRLPIERRGLFHDRDGRELVRLAEVEAGEISEPGFGLVHCRSVVTVAAAAGATNHYLGADRRASAALAMKRYCARCGAFIGRAASAKLPHMVKTSP